MPSTYKKVVSLLAFVAALVLLRLGILLAAGGIETFGAQSALIREQAIEPAAMFYTESPQARQAGRKVRERSKER